MSKLHNYLPMDVVEREMRGNGRRRIGVVCEAPDHWRGKPIEHNLWAYWKYPEGKWPAEPSHLGPTAKSWPTVKPVDADEADLIRADYCAAILTGELGGSN